VYNKWVSDREEKGNEINTLNERQVSKIRLIHLLHFCWQCCLKQWIEKPAAGGWRRLLAYKNVVVV
jgi:hypothetical protein